MSPQGINIYDAAGDIVIEYTDRLTQILDRRFIDPSVDGHSGTYAVTGITPDNFFVTISSVLTYKSSNGGNWNTAWGGTPRIWCETNDTVNFKWEGSGYGSWYVRVPVWTFSGIYK